MSTFQVIRKGQLISFESNFTFDQAIEVLELMVMKNSDEFAQSLLWQNNSRGLSARQIAWVHKLAVDYTTPKQAPKAVDGVNLKVIVEMLTKAGEHLKRPAIVLEVNNTPLRLSLAGPLSKNFCYNLHTKWSKNEKRR